MSERKTPQERIAALEKKEAQLRAQRQALIAKEKEAERKATIKRQIEIGKVTEKVYGIPIENIDMSQFEERLKTLVAIEQAIGKPLNKENAQEVAAMIRIGQAVSEVLGRPLTQEDVQKFKDFLEQQKEQFISEMEG